MYVATKWEPAKAKELFERQFKRFVLKGFREQDFPKTFYRRLRNCFGFIAHYDRNVFYATYFTKPSGIVYFFHFVVKHPCYGDPEYTYSDVEKVLQEWVIRNGLLKQAKAMAATQAEKEERAELERLQVKYGKGGGEHK